MKKMLFLFVATVLSIGTYAQNEWKVDPYHSSLNFNIMHSGISIVNGKFLEYSGTLTTEGEALKGAKFNFTIKTKSINTDVEKRDEHLRSADFFEVDKYPEMTFKSTKIESTKEKDHYLLHGKLTIKGVTKDVVFDVHYGGTVKNKQGEKLGLEAEATINRFDYNIDFDPTGGTVAKDVKLIVHLQFAKQ